MMTLECIMRTASHHFSPQAMLALPLLAAGNVEASIFSRRTYSSNIMVSR
jgi:hypothetical protein